jgi:hypothetical protein
LIHNNVFITSSDGGSERVIGMHPEDVYPSRSPSGDSAAFSSTIADGKERLIASIKGETPT